MNFRKTFAGVASGALALSSMAVAVSAAQEEKSTTINLQTTVCTGVSDVEASFYGRDLGNIFSELAGKTLEFNFDVRVTLPEKYAEDWFDTTYEGVTNTDGKSAALIIEGTDASGERIEKKISLKINEDGFYEFSVVAAGETAGRNEIAADYFTAVTDVTFDGELSFETPVEGGYVELPADAIGEIVAVNWNGEEAPSVEAFDKFISADSYVVRGVKGETLKGVLLEAEKAYNVNDLYSDAKLAIVDTINTAKGAKITFNFLSNEEINGLGWHNAWDNAGLKPELDVSYSALKRFAIGLNLENTRLLQQTSDVSENAVSFNWDELIAKSGLSAASGDIDTIHVRSGSDLVLASIVVDVPAISDGSDQTPGAGDEQETIATEETTSESESEAVTEQTEAVKNPATGNAPVALAAIPAALAAIAVVARKRR